MEGVAVGVDIGSSRIKVIGYGPNGSARHSVIATTPTVTCTDGVDFPVMELVRTVEAGVAEVARAAGPVLGVGVGTMGEVGTLLRDDGLADLSFPAWYDDRGSDTIHALEARFGRTRLDGTTGGHVRATSSLAKLAWMRRREPELSGVFVGLAGAVAWRLTGRAVQEGSLAATSGAWDPVARRYVPELWRAAGLAAIRPAEVLAAGRTVPADTGIASRLGIVSGAPVLVAGHDHPLAAVGTGARAGEVVDSMGTGEPVMATVSAGQRLSLDDVSMLVRTGLTIESWPADDGPLLIWEGLRPGLAMDHFLDVTGGEREVLDAEAPAPGSVTVSAELVRELEGGQTCRLPPGPRSWAAILDEYARQAAEGERAVRATTGATGVTILTGGGLRSPRWLAAKAVLGASVPVVSTATETVTRGAAALVGVALGWWPTTSDMPGAALLTTDKTGKSPAQPGHG